MCGVGDQRRTGPCRGPYLGHHDGVSMSTECCCALVGEWKKTSSSLSVDLSNRSLSSSLTASLKRSGRQPTSPPRPLPLPSLAPPLLGVGGSNTYGRGCDGTARHSELGHFSMGNFQRRTSYKSSVNYQTEQKLTYGINASYSLNFIYFHNFYYS